MAGDQHVRKSEQAAENIVADDLVREVFEKDVAFLFVNIEPEVAELAGLERLDDRERVHERAAAGVDQHRAVLHPRERCGVDDVVILRRERAVQADDVRAREQLIERHVAHAERKALGVLEWVHRQHLAIEPAHQLRDHRADLARADEPDRAPVKVKTEQPIEREVAFANAVVSAVQMPVERENEPDRVLRHRVRRIRRHPHDADAVPLCRREIDVVETCATQRDEPRAASGELCHHGRIHRIIHEDANGPKASRQRRRRSVEMRLEEVQLVRARVRRREEFTVVTLGAEDGGFHFGRTLAQSASRSVKTPAP